MRWITRSGKPVGFALATSFLLAVGVKSSLAQNDDNQEGGGALGEIIVWAIEEALRALFAPLRGIITDYGNEAIEYIVGTPHPETVFSAPTNNAWPEFYAYYWDTIVPLALLLWGLAVGIVIFLEATSHLFSGYHRAKLKRRAFAGLLGILSWWWLDALARQFIHELTVFLAPDLSDITLFETISFTGIGAISVVITMAVDFTLVALVFLIYVSRELILYLFTLLMPILIVLWIPGLGPFGLVSGFMKRLAGFYVPFLFMTVPVALFFRIGELLGQSFGLSVSGFTAWLVGLVMPLVAILSPFIIFWQAGAFLFTSERMAHHTSAGLARDRASRARESGARTTHGGRNFSRGLWGQPAIDRDGQTKFGSGDSRAHAAGSRMRGTGSTMRSTYTATSSTAGRVVNARSRSGSSKGRQSNSSGDRNQRFDSLRGSRGDSSKPDGQSSRTRRSDRRETNNADNTDSTDGNDSDDDDRS